MSSPKHGRAIYKAFVNERVILHTGGDAKPAGLTPVHEDGCAPQGHKTLIRILEPVNESLRQQTKGEASERVEKNDSGKGEEK